MGRLGHRKSDIREGNGRIWTWRSRVREQEDWDRTKQPAPSLTYLSFFILSFHSLLPSSSIPSLHLSIFHLSPAATRKQEDMQKPELKAGMKKYKWKTREDKSINEIKVRDQEAQGNREAAGSIRKLRYRRNKSQGALGMREGRMLGVEARVLGIRTSPEPLPSPQTALPHRQLLFQTP